MDKRFDWVCFDDSIHYKTNSYGGHDEKEKVRYNGDFYMLKYQKPAKQVSGLESEFSNSIYSEFISCHIFESIGLPVQETYLGTFKGVPVVACKDFTSERYKLSEFSSLENGFYASTKLGKNPALEKIMKLYDDYFGEFKGSLLKESFWDVFIVDSLLGNFDRHAGNWGFLVDQETGYHVPAPVYDCGSCLYPQMGDRGLEKILGNPEELDARIYVFPKSSITLGGQKISYVDFISSKEYPDCTAALKRILPRIDLKKIKEIIDATPGISELRKEFYFTMISARKEKILDYSLAKIQDMEKNSLNNRLADAVERAGEAPRGMGEKDLDK